MLGYYLRKDKEKFAECSVEAKERSMGEEKETLKLPITAENYLSMLLTV